MQMRERLKRLETAAKRLIVNLYPPDDDGFIHAICGDAAEQYRCGDGYDVLAALNATAAQDWAENADSV